MGLVTKTADRVQALRMSRNEIREVMQSKTGHAK